MEPFRIQFKQSAQKDMKKLEIILIQRILNSIELLSDDPTPRNSKKLKGVENIYRIRVGKYRIVYHISSLFQESP